MGSTSTHKSSSPIPAAIEHTFVGAAGVGRDARRHWLHRLCACDGVQAPGLRKAQRAMRVYNLFLWLSKDFLGSSRRCK